MRIRAVHSWGIISALSIASVLSQSAHAAVIKIGQDAFTPSAGKITFSEFGLGTQNPTYAPATYGGNLATDPTVNFGGFFQGQSLGNSSNCPTGAALTGCVVGTPSNILALNLSSPTTRIVGDDANPTSPVLSGSPTFNGPISILFDKDIAGVGLDGGFFDAIGGTAITAFARDGSLLGSVANSTTGIEFLGLATDDGSAKIAGLQFSLVGAEPAGFGIDNVRFGLANQVVVPAQPGTEVPEPFSILGTVAAAGFGIQSVRKRQQMKTAKVTSKV